MKNYLFGLLIVALVLQGAVFAETSTDTSTNTSTSTETDSGTSTDTSTETDPDATASKSLVPDNTAMNLDFSSENNVMPADFRGGDPDSELVNCLEDVYYEKHEHSLIYSDNPDDVAKGATFDGDPNITWTTSKKNDDGTFETVESKNTNMAREGGTLFTPGEYSIGNSGARQVNEPPEEVTTLTETDTSTSSSTETSTDTSTDTSKTVTANQTMGVVVHDCTAPDVWVAFQEGAGSVDMASTELELKQAIYTKVLQTAGRPFSDNSSDFEDASYLFIDEGAANERDKEPWNKTAAVTMAGALFNENGNVTVTNDTIKSGLISQKDQTRQVHVAPDEENKVSPIYIRRNVPFTFAAVSIDNGDERKAPTDVTARIENGDGEVIEKSDNAYLFRVPNYPREDYKDQPDYFFVAKAVDAAGNTTTVRLPVYIIDSNASFEASGR